MALFAAAASRNFRRGALALLLLSLALPAWADDIHVVASESFRPALAALGKAFEASSGDKISASFGASSALAKQVEDGAVIDMTILAASWTDTLDQHGLLQTATRRDLLGDQLVLIAPRDSKVTLTIVPGFALSAALAGGRLAIPDPEKVQTGRFTHDALVAMKAWDQVAQSLMPAENVRGALAEVAGGSAALGIVYRTDAWAEPRVRIVAAFPDNSHPPIVYSFALTRKAGPGAARFLEYLKRPEARKIYQDSGFVVLETN